jgi:hypothetical protein
MECWISAYLPWKTVTLLKSRSMVCCLWTEDNWSHFLQWNDNSWTLPGTDFEFYFPFRSWRTRLLVSSTWGCGAYSKFNNADVERVLWWSHYFSKPSIPRSIATGLWRFLKENLHINNPHTSEELKQNSELCVSNVAAETLHRVARLCHLPPPPPLFLTPTWLGAVFPLVTVWPLCSRRGFTKHNLNRIPFVLFRLQHNIVAMQIKLCISVPVS